MKNNTLTISEASAYAPTQIAKQYAARQKTRTKAFIEQGKLIYALLQKKLRSGQSIQGLLTAEGIPLGSIGNARKASAIIEALVISEMLSESDYDHKVTWRITRFANKVLGFDKGTEQIKPPCYVAGIIAEKNTTSAEIADQLECLAVHGVTLAEHQANLKAEKEDADKAEKIRKENEKELAEMKAKVEAEADEEIADEEIAEIDAPTKKEIVGEETPKASAPKALPVAPPAEIKATAPQIMEVITQAHMDALDLDAEGMKQVLIAINEMQSDLTSSLNELTNRQAA